MLVSILAVIAKSNFYSERKRKFVSVRKWKAKKSENKFKVDK